MTNTKKYFSFADTQLEEMVLDYLNEVIEYDGLEVVAQEYDLYENVQAEVFNSSRNEYIYYADAEVDLQNYGVFLALEEVQHWSSDIMGEDFIYTHSCDLANKFLYIRGDEYLSQFDDMGDLLDLLGLGAEEEEEEE